ncbi:hypothetical protein C6P45_005261 [Maudiozyma exigua]|uniref:DUF2428 domain-containing protein n=1 Tax=Maudiozyma exigua TaxID=34358 RepID=A0A9P7BAZ5_MAUEX|nr:hypothetical protein C6P45_005261 [Kazachstania exigua]
MNELITEAKVYLLQKDIITRIKEDNSDGTIETLITIFKTLFKPIESDSIELSDTDRLLMIDTLSIWMVRSTKIIQNQKINSNEFQKIMTNILLGVKSRDTLLQYIIDFWSDSTPALSNALRDLLNKYTILLKTVLSQSDFNSFLSKWLDIILNVPQFSRIHYTLVDSFSNELDMYRVIEKRPYFIEDALNEISRESLANIIGKCLVSLLTNIYSKHFKNESNDLSKWIKLWDQYTMRNLQKTKFTKPISLYFLTPLFKTMPSEIFVRFIKSENLHENPALLLSLLKIGQNISIEEPFHNSDLISLSILEEFLKTNEHKLQTFEILTFANKKSKTIQSYIFEVIKKNLKIFFVDVNLENRNYFVSSFKHFIIRIRDSAYAINRQLCKLKKANKFEDEQAQLKSQLNDYLSFLRWLVNFLKGEMIPGIQYHRNIIALQIFDILLCSGIDKNIPSEFMYKQERREYPFEISLCDDNALFRLLVDNLCNEVPEVRKLSKEHLLLFRKCEPSGALFEGLDVVRLNEVILQNFGVYQNSDIGATIDSLLFNLSPDKYTYLENHVERLQLEVSHVSKNYLKNSNNNMSSYLSSLSLILIEIDINDMSKHMSHTLEQIWDTILDIWELVRDILCYDATDSLIPEEYIKSGVSDQLLSSYAYRSVKEMSSVLIVLLDKFPLSEHLLTSIGDLLINQLFSIRHSGAFQAVLPCFRQCCLRCTRDHPAQLDMWLTLILEELQTKTQHITRRSGGLPFLLTNILSTERDKSHPKLRYVFSQLFEIANLPIKDYQDRLDLPQINAFNCIKAIFIESTLSTSCQPYISSALQLSFKYFTSEIWALRNCSLMLFTSIQNRIFGKSGKVLSARLFFTKYLGIKESMLTILQNANNRTKREGEHNNYESIFLVLSILLSLKGNPNSHELDIILDEVERFLGDENWKIRDVAARTIVALNSNPYETSKRLLQKSSTMNQNNLHGSLLVVFYAIENTINHETVFEDSSFIQLVTYLVSKCTYFTKHNRCFITSSQYLDNIISVLEKVPQVFKLIPDTFFWDLQTYFVYHNSMFETDGSKQLCLASALTALLSYGPYEIVYQLCEISLRSKFHEVQKTVTHFMIDNNFVNALSESERSILTNDLNNLLKQNDVLPSVATAAVYVLKDIESGIPIETVLSLIESSNAESTNLALLETMGQIATQDTLTTYIGMLSKYICDSATENSRVAALNSLKNFLRRDKNIHLLLLIYKMLSDDDVDIRYSAAAFINKELVGNNSVAVDISPIMTSHSLSEVLSTYFNKDEICNVLFKEITDYITKNDVFPSGKNECGILFKKEQDNQYRNNIEQNLQYISILENLEMNGTVTEFCKKYYQTLIKKFEQSEINDSPLGTFSDPYSFSIVVIFEALVNIYLTEKADEYKTVLQKHNIHPVVFEYRYLDLI